MYTMAFDCEDEKRSELDVERPRIVVEFHRERQEDGRVELGFTLERTGQANCERMSRFKPDDVLRLVCILRAVAGYYAAADELDPVLVGRMQALFDLLGDFMEYSIKRYQQDQWRQHARRRTTHPKHQ